MGAHNFHHQLPYAFISLDRLHDDLWDNPQDYIRIMRYLHEQSVRSNSSER